MMGTILLVDHGENCAEVEIKMRSSMLSAFLLVENTEAKSLHPH